MARNPLRKSPLQVPANSAEFLRTFVFERAPTSEDWRNFKISDLWIERRPGGAGPYGYFVLVDRPSQRGVWLELGTSPSQLGGLMWSTDTTTPINVNIDEGHIADGSGQITYNLPGTMKVGEGLAFYDLGGNGFKLQAPAGQTIRVGNQVSSSGGTVTSTAIGDAIWLVGAVPDTVFLASSIQGNLTVA